MMMLLTVFIIPHMGNGPFWASNIFLEANKCKHYWWANLLLVSNIIKVENQVNELILNNMSYIKYVQLL